MLCKEISFTSSYEFSHLEQKALGSLGLGSERQILKDVYLSLAMLWCFRNLPGYSRSAVSSYCNSASSSSVDDLMA